MPQRFAVIEKATNLVLNVIVLNDIREYDWLLDGTFVVQSDTANIGDTYDPNAQTFSV